MRAVGAMRALRSFVRRHSGRGYVGFGSFHGENVEEMMAMACTDAWPPPPLPPTVDAALQRALEPPILFGASCRRDHFLLSRDWCFVNHGAFGAPCRAAFEAAAAWRSHAEAQPLDFIDRHLFSHLVESTRQAARLLRASPRDVALLPNATSALNVAVSAAAAAARLGAGDEVLLLDVGYGSVRKIAERECARRGGARVVTASVLPGLPESARAESVVALVDAAITPRTKARTEELL